MNKERLEELAMYLEKLPPEKFDMETWCGTTCCIAGHSLNLARRWRPDPDSDDDVTWDGYGRPAAAEWLGLNKEQAVELMDYSEENESATPEQAAAVVRHLAETGQVEWERFVS